MRRWRDGWQATIDGIPMRVVQGYKSPDDLRMEWHVDGRWIPVRMNVGAVLADFFYENEDHLYPSGAGGRKYLGFLHEAARHGWRQAVGRLADEKATSDRNAA